MGLDIAEVGELDRDAFVERFGGVFEASPWVAQAAYACGPFADVDALYRAMAAVVATASRGSR
jgi:2-oxo-4-hydroxy-4-carboxy-5-ureidoimidazoline decarboxylase